MYLPDLLPLAADVGCNNFTVFNLIFCILVQLLIKILACCGDVCVEHVEGGHLKLASIVVTSSLPSVDAHPRVLDLLREENGWGRDLGDLGASLSAY